MYLYNQIQVEQFVKMIKAVDRWTGTAVPISKNRMQSKIGMGGEIWSYSENRHVLFTCVKNKIEWVGVIGTFAEAVCSGNHMFENVVSKLQETEKQHDQAAIAA